MSESATHDAIEAVARDSYGRLVAYIASRTGDIAIDVAARTPLMLQVVLGIDAAKIASAFLVSPVAMSQRLVRAKTKIRDACIPFRVPDPPDLDERVSFVLDAIYSAYTTGWDSLNEAGSTHHALAAQASPTAKIPGCAFRWRE